MSHCLVDRALDNDSTFVPGLGSAILGVNQAVSNLAATDIPILLCGESGTGKDAYAQVIHRLSHHHEASFVKEACTQLDARALMERIRSTLTSELPATLYLDGIDELEPACQRVLLSLLPDREPPRNERNARKRLISSSADHLEQQVAQRHFRPELYFRINAVCLRLPPLLERREDIPALLDFFLARHSSELQRAIPLIDSKTLDTLVSYHWPGNIRELANIARKIVAFGNVCATMADLRGDSNQLSLRSAKTSSPLKLASRAASNRAEREMILKALTSTQWNRKRAASELKISYKSLLYKIKELVVEKSDTAV